MPAAVVAHSGRDSRALGTANLDTIETCTTRAPHSARLPHGLPELRATTASDQTGQGRSTLHYLGIAYDQLRAANLDRAGRKLGVDQVRVMLTTWSESVLITRSG